MELEKNTKLKTIHHINKQRNISIEILRAFLCFGIILNHYYSNNNTYIRKIVIYRFQVPCFFFISFYFLYSIISKRNIMKMKLRLERLLIPYIIYPLIVWIINNFMFFIFKFNRFNRYLNIKELKTHIIIARGISGLGILWFQFDLLFLTLIFFISSFLLKSKFLIFFQIILLICYLVQYNGINYRFFCQYTLNVQMSIGNLIETLPIAIGAFTFSSINIPRLILKNRIIYMFLGIFFLHLIFEYNIFSILEGFSSRGIKYLIISLLLFMIFSLLQNEDFGQKVKVVILHITKYTQGIYCIHILILYYMKSKFNRNGNLIDCISLYLISYIFSFIGFKLFYKTKLKFLFN